MPRRQFLVGMFVCLVSSAGAEDAVQFSDPQVIDHGQRPGLWFAPQSGART